MKKNALNTIELAQFTTKKLLAILIDPDKFDVKNTSLFLEKIPESTTHIFVGGSTVKEGITEEVVKKLKLITKKPIFIFPGGTTQIVNQADALLFLVLLSGRNPEYLIGQQIKAVPKLRKTLLEVISTGYILIDGGNSSAVSRVTQTTPIAQENIQHIVDTAKAGELIGNKLIYLEAGSGAKNPVSEEIIRAVRKEINVPLLVGGGIRKASQMNRAYNAGANMVVMGTVYENLFL